MLPLGAHYPAQPEGDPKPWVWSRYRQGLPRNLTDSSAPEPYTQLRAGTRRLALTSALSLNIKPDNTSLGFRGRSDSNVLLSLPSSSFYSSPTSPWTQPTQRQATNPVFSTGDRDGDRHPEWRLHLHLPPSSPRSGVPTHPSLRKSSLPSQDRRGRRPTAKYNQGTHRPRPCPTCMHTRLVSQAWTAARGGWGGWGDSLAWLG